jgi:hypothetical protein
MSYVSHTDALAAFSDGDSVFDVDPHSRKLGALIVDHKLEAIIDSEHPLPCANPQGERREVYDARASRRGRHSFVLTAWRDIASLTRVHPLNAHAN